MFLFMRGFSSLLFFWRIMVGGDLLSFLLLWLIIKKWNESECSNTTINGVKYYAAHIFICDLYFH